MLEEILKIPKVNKVKIEDYGIIKEADIKFKEGLNIVTGKSASGKTTVIRFLASKFSPENLPYSRKIMLQIDNILDSQTILMDDILSYLNKKDLVKTLNKLSNSGKQVILTLNKYILSKIKDKIEANIIDTKDFRLKT